MENVTCDPCNEADVFVLLWCSMFLFASIIPFFPLASMLPFKQTSMLTAPTVSLVSECHDNEILFLYERR